MQKTIITPITDNGDSYSFITERGEEKVFQLKDCKQLLLPIEKTDMKITHYIEPGYYMFVLNGIPKTVSQVVFNKEQEQIVLNQYHYPVQPKFSTLDTIIGILLVILGGILLIAQMSIYINWSSLIEYQGFFPSMLYFIMGILPGIFGLWLILKGLYYKH